jgi:hypothetical protein
MKPVDGHSVLQKLKGESVNLPLDFLVIYGKYCGAEKYPGAGT